MRMLSAAVLFLLLGLAAACSGGGSSAPAATSSAAAVPGPAEEEPSFVPALPGLAGYEIPLATARGALALADESEETTWANETEETIVAQITRVLDDTMRIVAVECRTTWCGMVIDLPVGSDIAISGPIGDSLQEVFDVVGLPRVAVFRPDGTRWLAIYIEIRRLA